MHLDAMLGTHASKGTLLRKPQVFYKGGDDTSYMAYDAEECETSLNAFIHEMTDLETKGCWMRAW